MIKSGNSKFLIDGFPRNKDNLDGWETQMGAKVNLKMVLFFDCNQEVSWSQFPAPCSVIKMSLLQTCMERCLKRGAAGSGRSDDNEESLKKRFVTYINGTMPIIEHYDALGLVKKIDATQTSDQVFEEVKKIFS